MSLVPYWSGIQYSGYQRLGALALEYAAKYGVTAAYARMVLGKRKRLYPGMGGRFRKSRRKNTQVKRVVYRAIQQSKEVKWHITNANGDVDTPIDVPKSGTVVGNPENAIPLGTTTFQRVGNEVSLQRITYRMAMSRNTAAINQAIRVIVFTVKRPNGSTIFTTDYFDGINGLPLADVNTLYPKHPRNWFNGKTLFDRTYTMDANSGAPSTRHITFSIPLKNMLTRYNTSDTTGNQVETGGIYLLFISDAEANFPTVSYVKTLTFKDR